MFKLNCGGPVIRLGRQAFTRFEVTFARQGWGIYAPPILKKIKKEVSNHMTILETLVQLRDDLKTWVTNNLNALNSKIEEKTVPIDTELSSTSTNPVQNKAISVEINALKNQEHFSGNYNDLTNAPNISEDGSGNMVIADESGNIIFKVDFQGTHTTALTLSEGNITAEKNDNLSITDESGNIIFKADAEGIHSTNLKLNGDLISMDADKFQITDENGFIAFQVDETGAQAKKVIIDGKVAATETYVDEAIAAIEFPEVDLTGYATETYVNEQVESAKKEISESIMSEGEDFTIVDEDGRIAFQVANDGVKAADIQIINSNGAITTTLDENGIETTKVVINGEDVSENFDAVNKRIDEIEIPSIAGLATETYVDNKVADLVNSAPETLNTLDELAAALGDDENFATTVTQQIGQKANQSSLEEHTTNSAIHVTSADKTNWNNKSDFDGKFSSLSDSPIVEDESGDLVIADPDGNIIFRSGGSGVETTIITAQTVKVGGSNITAVDSELSVDSTNPVQNKVISTAINHIVDDLIGGTTVSEQINTAIAQTSQVQIITWEADD